MTKQEIIKIYHEKSYNHDYIIGFEMNKKIMACILSMTAEMIDMITTLSKSSSKNGGCDSIRFRPNKDQKQFIINNSKKVDEIMDSKEFEEINKNSAKPNRGDMFEVVVAKYYHGQQQQQRNLKWTDGGDVIINGHHYQCKFNKATWTTEKTVLRVA